MRKIFLFSVLMLAGTAVSCQKETMNVNNDGTGSIILNSQIEGVVVETRATPALESMSVILDGPYGPEVLEWPSDGVISGIVPGLYDVTVTTFPNGHPRSGFGNMYFEGKIEDIEVVSGQTAVADISCSQQNGGVFFEFSAEMLALNIVPSVTGADGEKVAYTGHTAETAYFPAGTAILTVTVDGVPAVLSGRDSYELEIKAGVDYRINLKGESDEGTMQLNVESVDPQLEEISIEVVEGERPDVGIPTVEWDAVPAEGSYTMSSEDNLFGFNETGIIEGTFKKIEENKTIEILGWPVDDSSVLPMTLVYDEAAKVFYVSREPLVEAAIFVYAYTGMLADETIIDDDFVLWVPVDPEAGTFDFSYLEYEGEPVYIGCYSTGMMSGPETDFLRGVASYK